jgi:hypothetical protein
VKNPPQISCFSSGENMNENDISYIEKYKRNISLFRKAKIFAYIEFIILFFYLITIFSFIFVRNDLFNATSKYFIIAYSIITFFLIFNFIPFFVYFIKATKCPKCKKATGRSPVIFCPHCGTKLQDDNGSTNYFTI